MKKTLYVHYTFHKYCEGFRYFDYISGDEGYIYLGEIEIDNPFNEPDISVINAHKLEMINEKIKEHKAEINVLENQAKDLLCIENKEVTK